MPLPNDLELLASFVAESRLALPAIRAALATSDPEAVATAGRLVHTIKGTAAVLGLNPLAHLAYRVEEHLRGAAAGDPTFLSRAVDAIDSYLALDVNDLTDPANTAPLTGLATGTAPDRPPGLATGGTTEQDETPPRPPESSVVTPEWPTFPPAELTHPEPAVVAPEPPPAREPDDTDAVPISADILEVFAAEADEHLRTVGRALAVLQQQPDSRDHLQEIRRAFHTLKGAAASVGFTPLASLAHRTEDWLDVLYDAGRPTTADEIDLLLAAHDALDDLAAGRPDRADTDALYPRLAVALAAARAGTAATAGSAAEPPVAPDPAPEPASEPAPDVAAAAGDIRAAGEALRVPIGRIDDVVKLVGELVISRSGFEQHIGRFGKLLQELQLSADRLSRATARLETQYEARALGGNRLAGRFGGAEAHGFDGLEFDRYTDFHLVSRELSETATDIGTVAHELSALTGDFDGYLLRQSRLTAEMQDKLMRVRMVPFAHLSSRLHRTVRRAAAALGKPVRLVLEGEATELDKTVLEEMSEPLLHLLRNAVDHGIEDQTTRAAAGKPAAGTVTVRAAAEGTQVVIRVSDDGRGIDLEAVRAAAVAKGFLPAEAAAAAGPDALTDLLFEPGFSTTDRVSDLSGRGVGLDIVKVMVARLKGTVSLASAPGRGTTFTVRLPLTLAVIRALMVKAAGQVFAVPLGAVSSIHRLDPGETGRLGDQDVFHLAGETIPQFALAVKLALRGTSDAGPRPPVVVLSVADRKYAVVVDEVVGGREVVLKSLGAHVRRAPGIAGATLMGDGSVVLILDPGSLFATARPAAFAPHASHPRPAAVAAQDLTVLVVDDSPSVRRVVTGQLRDAGFGTLTAKDGLDALDVLHHQERLPDALLLDVEMPRMDGYELLSTLRSNPTYRHLPVIMLTSRAGEKHRRKATELGATAYLVKPYQPGELVGTIRGAVQAPAATG